MVTEFKRWLKQPFDAEMDTFHWMLFVLLLLLILGFWGMTLRHLTVAIKNS